MRETLLDYAAKTIAIIFFLILAALLGVGFYILWAKFGTLGILKALGGMIAIVLLVSTLTWALERLENKT